MLLFVHIFCSVLRIRSCCLYPFCWCKCSGSCRVCLCVCVRACALSLSHFFFFLPVPSVWLNYGEWLNYGDESRYFRFPSPCPYGLTAWLLLDVGFIRFMESPDISSLFASSSARVSITASYHDPFVFVLYLYIICTGRFTRHWRRHWRQRQ